MTRETPKRGEAAQAADLAADIRTVVRRNCEVLIAAGVQPLLNAVFGALALTLAEALAAVENPGHRLLIRAAFDRAVDARLAQPDLADAEKAQTIVVGERSTMQ